MPRPCHDKSVTYFNTPTPCRQSPSRYDPCYRSSHEVISMPGTARAKEPSIEKLPLEERVRRRAYELYVLRGNQSGSEFDDWLQAEEEILCAEEQERD